MSLFENDQFRWRETYFVFFDEARRPTTDRIVSLLAQIDPHYEIGNPVSEEDQFASLTLRSPDDYAAMDITCTTGEEASEQGQQMALELLESGIEPEQTPLVERLPSCTARLDIFHFEQIVAGDGEQEEDECLDPGSVLIVLDKLAQICDGIAVDPQSSTFI